MQEVLGKLGEHYDVVVVLGSFVEDGVTKLNVNGFGNWYARQGMAREFTEHDQANTLAHAIAERLP